MEARLEYEDETVVLKDERLHDFVRRVFILMARHPKLRDISYVTNKTDRMLRSKALKEVPDWPEDRSAHFV